MCSTALNSPLVNDVAIKQGIDASLLGMSPFRRSDTMTGNAAYEGTRITGPGKSREPDPDGDMEARLMMMLKDRKKVDHVLKVSSGGHVRGVCQCSSIYIATTGQVIRRTVLTR